MRIETRTSWGDLVYPLLFLGLHVVLYRGVLKLGFTGGDTFSLIESSRVGTPWELGRLLSSRFMAGTSFFMDYYRPVTSLSFALDELVWGLNPAGYHFTDLLLQGVALAGCFLFLRALAGVHAGGLGTLLFAGHPILVEVVPAVARRQDVLAGLFTVFSLWMFLRARRKDRTSRWILSSGLFVLAVASKESAVIMLIFPFGFALLFPETRDGTLPDRLREALRTVMPYLAPVGVYWVWRSSVLGTAVGGRIYAMSPRSVWFGRIRGLTRMTENMFPFLRAPSLTLTNAAGALLLVLVLVVWGVRWWPVRSRTSTGEHPGVTAATCRALVGLSVIVVLLYPFCEFAVRSIVRQAYHGTGYSYLSAWMDGRAATSVAEYVSRARQLWLGAWLGVAAAAALPAWGGCVVRMVREPGRYRRATRRAVILTATAGTWLGLLIYRVEFTPRNLYLPVLLLCGLLALMLVAFVRTGETGPVGLPLAVLTALLVGWTACYSPLFQPYPGWDCASRTAATFLRMLPDHVDAAKTRSLVVRNFPPGKIRTPGLSVRSASVISPYSVASWYRLRDHGSSLESVRFKNAPTLPACPDSPDDWRWTVDRREEKTVVKIGWFEEGR